MQRLCSGNVPHLCSRLYKSVKWYRVSVFRICTIIVPCAPAAGVRQSPRPELHYEVRVGFMGLVGGPSAGNTEEYVILLKRS